jgi:hypothetical protein
MASYPEKNAEWMPWSNFMLKLSDYIFPPNHPDTPRFYTGLGLTFLAVGIHFSDFVKALLSHKYLLWLGKNSFAVYLLHGTLLRTVLVWMEYGFIPPQDIVNDDGTVHEGKHLELGGRLRFWFWIPVWFVLQYYLANLWTSYVDPFCARVTEKIEKYVFEDEEEKSVLPQ